MKKFVLCAAVLGIAGLGAIGAAQAEETTSTTTRSSFWSWMPKAEAPVQNPEASEEAPRRVISQSATTTTTTTTAATAPQFGEPAVTAPAVEPAAGKRPVQKQDTKEFNN